MVAELRLEFLPCEFELRPRLPVKTLDLLEVQADERVAVPERVIEERERQVLRERDEPERELREAHGERILVDAVQAPLRDEATRVHHGILVRLRDRLDHPFARPRRDDRVAEVPARLDEERAGAHRRVADLEVQDALARRRGAHHGEQRFERAANDRFRERARRVVAARAAALGAGLQHETSGARGLAASHARVGEDLARADDIVRVAQALRELLGRGLREPGRLLDPLRAARGRFAAAILDRLVMRAIRVDINTPSCRQHIARSRGTETAPATVDPTNDDDDT